MRNQRYGWPKRLLLWCWSFLGRICRIYCRYAWTSCLLYGNRRPTNHDLVILLFIDFYILKKRRTGSLSIFILRAWGTIILHFGPLSWSFLKSGPCIHWIYRIVRLSRDLFMNFWRAIINFRLFNPRGRLSASELYKINNSWETRSYYSFSILSRQCWTETYSTG